MRKALVPVLLALLVAPAAVGQPTSAEDVLKAHVEAAGGEAAFRALTNRYSVGEISLDTPMGPIILNIEQQIVFPGYGLIRQTAVTTPPEIPAEMMKQTVFLTPDGGWLEAAALGGRTDIADLPGPQSAALSQQRGAMASASDELALLANDSVEVALGEPETVNDTEVFVVEVLGGTAGRRMYAADTGLLFATEMTLPTGRVRQFFSDYRTVSGVRVPFAMRIEQPGQAITVSFSEISFDRGLTPESITAAAEGN